MAHLFPDLPDPIFYTPLHLREPSYSPPKDPNSPLKDSDSPPKRPPHPGNDPEGWRAYLRSQFQQFSPPRPVEEREDRVETSRRGVRF